MELYRLFKWVADGKKASIEEVIEMTNLLLCNGVQGLMKDN